MSEIEIKTLKELGGEIDIDKQTFIFACEAEGDLVIDKGLGRIKVNCPVLKREIRIESGICQETNKTCEWHM